MSALRPPFTASSIVIVHLFQNPVLSKYALANSVFLEVGVEARITILSDPFILEVIDGDIAVHISVSFSHIAHSSHISVVALHPLQALGFPEGNVIILDPFANFTLS